MGFSDPDVYIEYSDLLLDMDESEMAFNLMKKGILEHPNSDILRAVNAGFLLEMDEYELAFDELKTGMEMNIELEEIFFEAFPDFADDEKILKFFKTYK